MIGFKSGNYMCLIDKEGDEFVLKIAQPGDTKEQEKEYRGKDALNIMDEMSAIMWVSPMEPVFQKYYMGVAK